MFVDKEKIEKVLSQLPEDLQREVLEFAESLIRKTAPASSNGSPSVQSLFGVWDSGDAHSADNDRIDADLAREFASPHEAK
jgi:hypothetical protein